MTQQVRTGYQKHRKATWAIVIALAALAAAVVIPIASGAADKTYTLAVAPTWTCSSATEGDASVLVTLGNTAKSASLGSAEIYFPANSISTSPSFAPAFSPARSGSTIALRSNASTNYGTRDVVAVSNLNLAKNNSLGISVRFKANAKFVGFTDITAVVKQSNNFNDTSGTANLFDDPPANGTAWPSFSLADCATVSGLVWNDQDQSGTPGATEPGQGNWTVRAYTSGTPRTLVATATSSTVSTTLGEYSMKVPKNASYVLCETAPSGSWGQTTPGSGTSCTGTYSGLTEEPNAISSFAVAADVPNKNFGNVPTVALDCASSNQAQTGTTSSGTYGIELGTSGASTCGKQGTNEYSFDTWKNGNQTFFKFVPATSGAGGINLLLAEKLETSYSPDPTAASPQATLVYDDNLSDGWTPVEMPYCNFDPRTNDADKITITPRDTSTYATIAAYANAVLPSGHTSCLLEATQKIRATQTSDGKPILDVTFYVFSAVDGGRGVF